MTLAELKYIVAVAHAKHFGRAAERSFISQPSLSAAVKNLEEELGVKLFERSKTEVTVTPIGAQIIEQAQRVLEEAAKIKSIASQGGDQLAGPLNLGVIYTTGPYLLPKLIPALRKTAPHMPLQVEENLTANLEISLKNGRIDVAIIALPFDVPGIQTAALYDENFKVVIPSDHAWAGRKSIRAGDLAKENLLLLDSGHCFSNQVAEACPEIKRRSGAAVSGNSLETIRNMVASGLGITVMPAGAADGQPANKLLEVVPFMKPIPARRMALAWRKSFSRPDAVNVLASAIQSIKAEWLRPVSAPG